MLNILIADINTTTISVIQYGFKDLHGEVTIDMKQ